MTDKIEEVARAILLVDAPEVDWEEASVSELYIKLARAAIKALKNPTQAMTEVSLDLSPAHAASLFNAMVDAALEVKP